MKKLLFIFICIFILTGCAKETMINIMVLDNDYKLLPNIKDNCNNELEEYYEYNEQKLYLVCLDELNMETNQQKNALLNIETVKDYFEYIEPIIEDNRIIVYLDNNITQEEIIKVKEKIDSYENIIEPSTIKTKEEWKSEMSNSSENISDVFDSLTENPLSDTIEVKVSDIALIKETANYIKNLEKVSNVQYTRELISDFEFSSYVISDFIENVITNNKPSKTIDVNNDTVYKYDNLSIITCNDNKKIYIGSKNLNYDESFCK